MTRPREIKLTSIKEIFSLLESGADSNYFGEKVSQLDHSLQAAHLAKLFLENRTDAILKEVECQGTLVPYKVKPIFSSVIKEHVSNIKPENFNAIIITSLLHDMGHRLNNENLAYSKTKFGVAKHEVLGAKYLQDLGFSETIWTPIKLHIQAKHYLIKAVPGYKEALSSGSTGSWRYQKKSVEESDLQAFQKNPFYYESLLIRAIDDSAKTPGLKVPGLENYRKLIFSVLENQRTNCE